LSATASVLLVAVGLFYTNAANRSQQELAERGQVTERFTRAIDQLGSEDVDVRLGGIYGLERLTRDSPSDQRDVIEVLSAYVRRKALASAAATSPSTAAPPAISGSRSTHLATDVQAGLTVLGRLPSSADRSSIDLRDASLHGADLSRLNFSGANLSGAKLAWAYITNSDLSRANLSYADLSGANLAGATLNEAALVNADLSNAQLGNANLSGAKLNFAILASANLAEAGGVTSELVRCSFVDLQTFMPEGVSPSRLDLTYVIDNATLNEYADPECWIVEGNHVTELRMPLSSSSPR
jgi:uncharacterized protein YjbI with pentapeptide repeats